MSLDLDLDLPLAFMSAFPPSAPFGVCPFFSLLRDEDDEVPPPRTSPRRIIVQSPYFKAKQLYTDVFIILATPKG